MPPLIVLTADLGNEEFTTFAELRDLVHKAHHEADCPLVAVYITPFQLKLLRFEAFERRKLTNEQARRLEFKTCLGTRVIVWDGEGVPPCPNCEQRHY